MLEDESGRVRLVGQRIMEAGLVTGVILGALGMETANGDFEVVDICFAGMAPQNHSDDHTFDNDDMDVDEDEQGGEELTMNEIRARVLAKGFSENQLMETIMEVRRYCSLVRGSWADPSVSTKISTSGRVWRTAHSCGSCRDLVVFPVVASDALYSLL